MQVFELFATNVGSSVRVPDQALKRSHVISRLPMAGEQVPEFRAAYLGGCTAVLTVEMRHRQSGQCDRPPLHSLIQLENLKVEDGREAEPGQVRHEKPRCRAIHAGKSNCRRDSRNDDREDQCQCAKNLMRAKE